MMLFKSERAIHKKIKEAIFLLEKDSEFISLNVRTIAEKAGTSLPKTMVHLDIMEEDSLGIFCDDKKQTFSTSKMPIEKIKKESEKQ